MTYSNDVIGFDSALYGKREAVAATEVYCDACAETVFEHNPDHNPADPYGPERLRREGFNWQPVFGAPCTSCGVDA